MSSIPNPNTPNGSGAGTVRRAMQVLLGLTVIVLLVGGAALFLLNGQVRTVQAAVDAKEAQVGTSEQIARRCQETEATYNATLARTQFLKSSVSTKAYVPTLLQQLQTLATATHLTVTAVRPGAIAAPVPAAHPAGDAAASSDSVRHAPPPPYDTLDISVDLNGTYADTVSFLYGLTRFPKIVSVTGVQLHPGSGSSGPPGSSLASAGRAGASAAPVVATNLHLTAFVFHDDNAPAAPPPAAPALVPPGVAIRQANQTRREVGVGTL